MRVVFSFISIPGPQSPPTLYVRGAKLRMLPAAASNGSVGGVLRQFALIPFAQTHDQTRGALELHAQAEIAPSCPYFTPSREAVKHSPGDIFDISYRRCELQISQLPQSPRLAVPGSGR